MHVNYDNNCLQWNWSIMRPLRNVRGGFRRFEIKIFTSEGLSSLHLLAIAHCAESHHLAFLLNPSPPPDHFFWWNFFVVGGYCYEAGDETCRDASRDGRS
jgi:hypothetical protein